MALNLTGAVVTNLAGAPRAVALELVTSQLNSGDGPDAVLTIFGGAYFEAAANATFQDIFAPTRPNRADHHIQKCRAEFKVAPLRAERHLAAKLLAALVSAQVVEAAVLTAANSKPDRSGARTM